MLIKISTGKNLQDISGLNGTECPRSLALKNEYIRHCVYGKGANAMPPPWIKKIALMYIFLMERTLDTALFTIAKSKKQFVPFN